MLEVGGGRVWVVLELVRLVDDGGGGFFFAFLEGGGPSAWFPLVGRLLMLPFLAACFVRVILF
jgi:hypothetical protein